MILSRTTPTQHFQIRSVRWKKRAIGLAKYRIGTHNSVEITQTGKDGQRYFPDTYYISGKDIHEGLKSGKFELDNQKGVDLVIVPINEMEPLERE